MAVSSCVEVLSTSHSPRWREVLGEIGTYDFYHLPEFHRLAEMRGEGSAVMPVFREAGYTIAFPLLVRHIDIPGCREAGLRDATSVYGFAGPLASDPAIPEHVRLRFLGCLEEFLGENRIISVFSRLSPVLDQRSLLNGSGEVVERGVTLAIDLTVSPEEQFARYRRDHRQDIRHLRDRGFRCQEAGFECLDDLVRIYDETMQRVDAGALYRFDRRYFEFLMREMGDVMHLFVCKTEGTVVGAALATVCGTVAEIHLSGTATEFLRVSPIKLLRDSIRVWATEMGAKILHLGGGIDAQRDSLYHHKLGFGAHELSYYTWRLVVDERAYNELARAAGSQANNAHGSSYFPAYRAPR